MLNLSECEQIFFNEPLIILEGPKHSLSEKRWAAFGKTEADRLLTILFYEKRYAAESYLSKGYEL